MITDLNVIVKEWAYRVHNGKPNPNNSAHLYQLSEILIENKWPMVVVDEFIQKNGNLLAEIAKASVESTPVSKDSIHSLEQNFFSLEKKLNVTADFEGK